jgi:putative membrane-bound dehydrogenase-like protein
MSMIRLLFLVPILCSILFKSNNRSGAPAKRIDVLFLGHTSKHHDSEKLADIFLKELFINGINISYTTDVNMLNDSVLSLYDALIVYANYDTISRSQEKALLDFVRSGKGFVPLHSASHCFRNSPEVVSLIGGQFDKHGLGSFEAIIENAEHPVLKDIRPFTTTDETYIHKNLAPDIEVLTVRKESGRNEPYTWVKKFGKGRVFYTAYGHDENTFNKKEFIDLVKNGILWAVGEERTRQLDPSSLATLEYYDAAIPNYERREPAPRAQKALAPEQSMSQMQVPAGFELQLFAAEPDIINPIFMNWDERGRLWVIETVDYPNEIKDDDEGDDRIKILEDTDGDGRADKFTTFADKLNIPTSFVFVDGGIIVSSAPSFIFLKDSNNDDKADVRKKILNGWGKFDTHAQASNLRYGVDNNIWGVVGYSGFKGKFGNDSIKFSNGLFRFSPDGTQLEHLSTTSNNTWGLGFSEEFDVFISTANNTHTGFFGIPKTYLDKGGIKESGVKKLDAHYNMHVATKNLRQVDVHGGFTAAAGHALYTARSFPREYWNRIAFVTEPTGRIIHQVKLKKKGAGFIEDGDGWNILTSSDEWFGPVQAEVGPDGALWVADWYDFIIQHNPTPTKEKAGLDAVNGAGNAYITPLRDHDRGRIYRVVHKDAGANSFPSLDKSNVQQLLGALRSDNMFWRLTAQRLLVERGVQDAIPTLMAYVKDTVDQLGLNNTALHALWTLKGLQADQHDPAAFRNVINKALRFKAPAVRKAAIQVATHDSAFINELSKAKLFADKDLRVRLAAFLALADVNTTNKTADLVAQLTTSRTNTEDEWLRAALTAAAKAHGSKYEAAARKRKIPVIYANEKSTKNETAAASKKETIAKRITLKVVRDQMKFDQQLITAKAGTTIEIILDNPDFMQHNFVLIKPGTSNQVGAAADKLAQNADGAKLQYVPQMPEVLKATPLVNPGQKFTLTLKVPDRPGDYPYLCTFPGHWRIMNGVLRVTN